MAKPLLSVLIDTYNHERFIEQAIVSVLEQEIADAEREVLVVDDGSTDHTPEIVQKFEPRVRLIRKGNGGQASAFNVGIPQCAGEMIAFLDGDDWWAPGKLRAVANVLASDAAIGLVGHGIVESLENGVERIVQPEKTERFRLDSLAHARVFRLRKTFLGTSRMALRAKVAREILPVPPELVIEADEYLFTVAAAVSEMVILRAALSHYRLHAGNLYLAAGSSRNSLRRKQLVHEALTAALRSELPARGVPPDAVDCVTEIIQAEGNQIRLMLDGGAPRETVRTEATIYQILHQDAQRNHRIFRALTMIPAYVLPPKRFYQARGWAASHRWYGQLRRQFLPMPWGIGVNGQKDARAESLKKRLANFWDSRPAYYDSVSTSEAATSPERQKAASFLPEGGKVLDVACGSAANAPLIGRRCAYFGADISQTGLRRAAGSALRLVCGDADELPFASECFDATISTFALEHCVNPVRMLREMRRVVRPGGRIVLLGPSWDLPFWYPNALQSKLRDPGRRIAYTCGRFLGQLRGWIFGQLPFLRIEDPDVFHRELVNDADAVYVVWTYEVVRQMKSFGCRLLHAEVDDRMWGTRSFVRLLKHALYLLPLYRHAGSTVLLVFER